MTYYGEYGCAGMKRNGRNDGSPVTTCAEENILAYQIDKYHAEDILIHEFAHSIHLIGISQVRSLHQ